MVDIKKSWKEAQSHCRDKGMDLVSGEAQIQKDISLSRGENVWIGLFRETWKWSDGSSFNFRNWDQQNPDKGECALIKSEKWKSNDCKETKPFICYEDKIKLIKQNKTWQEAMDYCREHHNDLISITDVHQQRWVQERAKNAQTEFIWLGLRYTCTLDMWFWVTGEDFIYDNWESCPPTQGCYSGAAMKTDEGYKWVTRRDNETFNFICTL
nr:PREDICTED: macrophage mannose receptor 1-like [Paralichthys olivaceus]